MAFKALNATSRKRWVTSVCSDNASKLDSGEKEVVPGVGALTWSRST